MAEEQSARPATTHPRLFQPCNRIPSRGPQNQGGALPKAVENRGLQFETGPPTTSPRKYVAGDSSSGSVKLLALGMGLPIRVYLVGVGLPCQVAIKGRQQGTLGFSTFGDQPTFSYCHPSIAFLGGSLAAESLIPQKEILKPHQRSSKFFAPGPSVLEADGH